MTPTPPSLTPTSPSSQDHHTGSDQYRVVRKRNRVPLSCAPCRNRKLKCNRSVPCENCVKRGDANSCSYASPGVRKKSTATTHSSASSPDDMQNRIDRLEGLVLSLMTNGAQSAGPTAAARALSLSSGSNSVGYSPVLDTPDEDMVKDELDDAGSDTDRVTKSLGVLHVNNNNSMYVGDAHWAAILHDISEVRNYFVEHKKAYEDQVTKIETAKQQNGSSHNGPAFLFGARNLPRLPELIAALPGRDAVDKMVTRIFNDDDPAMHILHAPSWRRKYEKHWQDPSKTDAVWLGQLFAMLCLAMTSYHRENDEPFEYKGRTLSLASNYRMLTAQCLLLADYTKPVNYMIETMLLHLRCEHARSKDAEMGIWVLIGMIVRLAMRGGYHRDPKNYPGITPFQSEMRRRIWTFVRKSDVLFSFQIGLPSMIRVGDCDTEIPSNLYDDDFDEDSKVLPPSRPSTVPTPISYMIAKAGLTFSFGKIIEYLHCIRQPPYEEVMKLDQDLREAYANVAPHLRLLSLDEAMVEPLNILVMRFNISILYNKSQCVLHRRFLDKARENTRYTHSRRTCVDSSMELLRHQAALHFESRPGKRLSHMKWYFNSLTSHDFLLAATLVCLDLCHTEEVEASGRRSGDYEMWGTERRTEMVNMIATSRDIWTEHKDESIAAFKASAILGVMLRKLQAMHAQTAARKSQNPYLFPNPTNPKFTPPEDEKPEHSAALTLGMLSTGGLSPNTTNMYNSGFNLTPGVSNPMVDNPSTTGMVPNFSMTQAPNGIASAPSPFSFLTSDNSGMEMPPGNLDWDAWDSYIQNSSLEAGNEIWPPTMDMPLGSADGVDQLLQQQQNNMFANPNAMFMGANSSPGNHSM